MIIETKFPDWEHLSNLYLPTCQLTRPFPSPNLAKEEDELIN